MFFKFFLLRGKWIFNVFSKISFHCFKSKLCMKLFLLFRLCFLLSKSNIFLIKLQNQVIYNRRFSIHKDTWQSIHIIIPFLFQKMPWRLLIRLGGLILKMELKNFHFKIKVSHWSCNVESELKDFLMKTCLD